MSLIYVHTGDDGAIFVLSIDMMAVNTDSIGANSTGNGHVPSGGTGVAIQLPLVGLNPVPGLDRRLFNFDAVLVSQEEVEEKNANLRFVYQMTAVLVTRTNKLSYLLCQRNEEQD